MPAKLPRPAGDLTVKLWRDGYRALAAERLKHEDPDAFPSTMLGRRAAVVRGPEGVRLFYDADLVERRRAIPAPLAGLLFGRGAVHGLDGAAHAARKSMFLELLADERFAPLADAVTKELTRRAGTWSGRDVVVFDELVEAYGGQVMRWAGIDAPDAQLRRWSQRLAAIVDGFGFAGSAYARGWAARTVSNRWAARLVDEVRAGRRSAPEDSVLTTLAATDLPARVAGVELLNVLRPTVAVAWPGTFAVLALSEHPQWRENLRALTADGDDVDTRRVAFGHEVRRLYPFVPALAGRARRPLRAAGIDLKRGDRIVLDVVGTDQDPELWHDPKEFMPERFADVQPDPHTYVPQGGGDPATGHRCPGEPLTVRLLAETIGVFADLDFEVVTRPAYDPARMPTRPEKGLVIRIRS